MSKGFETLEGLLESTQAGSRITIIFRHVRAQWDEACPAWRAIADAKSDVEQNVRAEWDWFAKEQQAFHLAARRAA